MEVFEHEFRIIQYFALPRQIADSKAGRYIGVRLYVRCGWSLLIYCVSAINFSLALSPQISLHFLCTKEILRKKST